MKTTGIIFTASLMLVACNAPTQSKSYGQLEGMVNLSESQCAAEGNTVGSETFIQCVNNNFDPTGALTPVYTGR